MTRRLTVLMTLVLAGLLVPVSSAMAEPPPPPKCFRMNSYGEPATCTWNGHNWSVDHTSAVTGGIPGGFVAVFLLVLFVGIGLTIWRVSTARQLARRAGMDQDQATAMALLEDDGLEATYLAANLRGPRPQPATESGPRSTESRLRELQQLRDDGLVNEEEYQERRRAILDSL